jgi:hypothetical protein
MFVAGLFTFVLTRAITYYLARQQGDASCLVLVGLLMTVCIGLIATALGALFIPTWLQEYPAQVITFAQWLMQATPAGLLMWLPLTCQV